MLKILFFLQLNFDFKSYRYKRVNFYSNNIKTGKIQCILFALGENLDGAQLSFTTHTESCQWERRSKVYRININSNRSIDAHASITINLPYYSSILYMCLTPKNSTKVIHQGSR